MGNAKAPYSVAKANRDEKVRRWKAIGKFKKQQKRCLLYTSPSPRDLH